MLGRQKNLFSQNLCMLADAFPLGSTMQTLLVKYLSEWDIKYHTFMKAPICTYGSIVKLAKKVVIIWLGHIPQLNFKSPLGFEKLMFMVKMFSWYFNSTKFSEKNLNCPLFLFLRGFVQKLESKLESFPPHDAFFKP